MRASTLLFLVVITPLLGPLPGCLLDVPVGTIEPATSAAPDKLDILLVIDNSGSMCEEQLALNQSLFGPDCPVQSLNDPGPYLHPSPAVATELMRTCGLTQMLAAFDTDFRIGMITTDVGPCDNRYGFAELEATLNCHNQAVSWGRRPQRGCLQSASTWGRPWLTREDGDFASRLAEGIDEIGTHGSPFERGLDAVDIFLDPAATRAPGCDRHAADFLRDDARLVVVFATDEDDCSHSDGASGLPDENAGESCGHTTEVFYSLANPDVSPSRCYAERGQLTPVADYAARWHSRTGGDLSIFVLGGVAPDGDGRLVADGCAQDASGVVHAECYESQGASSLTGPSQVCEPGAHDQPCCTADGSTRYMELASLTENSGAASICGDFSSAFKRLQDLVIQ